ncbi:hypothetical protein [uncultured Shewanella sp.]|uniref:hypothetical protein n=1 Tax=uncultured Shewanella sp. TaxID=173975 RepID=UPI00262FFC76|nr:hypothetical protein [uncultured Shewanella sp.]
MSYLKGGGNKSSIQPKQNRQSKVQAVSEKPNRITHFDIEQIDLPFDIGLYGQRQILHFLQIILAKGKVGVLNAEQKRYFNIAQSLASQVIEKKQKGEADASNQWR